MILIENGEWSAPFFRKKCGGVVRIMIC
jgi:hypothetical protein